MSKELIGIAVDHGGFVLKHSVSDEIRAAVMEMHQTLSHTYIEDQTAVARFLEIGGAYQALLEAGGEPVDPSSISAKQTQYGFALPWTRLADSYLETHPDFLE